MLVLDELQKVRGWSETLKLLWDARNPGAQIRVLILGSSALLMQAGLSESLAGRFFLHRCTHWDYPECRTAFGWSLEQWLFFGGYPGAAAFAANEIDWKRYIVDFVRDGLVGNGEARWGSARWRRITEERAGAKSVFHLDGSLGKFLKPAMLPGEYHVARIEGWIVGVM